MLDDPAQIKEKDPQDALGVAEKQWQQLQYDYNTTLNLENPIKQVVLAGMGGSALPGVFLSAWPQVKVSLEIVRNYTLPRYVGNDTLVISSSYSGGTEESLSALADAESKNASIAVVAAGGRLMELAKEKNHPLFTIPGGIQPRMCTFYFLAAFIQMLEPLGLVDEGSRSEMQEAATWLSEQTSAWNAQSPSSGNLAKQIAQEIQGKTIIMYGGPLLFPAANKWKICMNENAKNLAWSNQYPELNHNEFIGWSSHPTEKPFAVIELRSDLEHERVQKRFTVTERLLSGKRPQPIVVKPQGKTILQQLLWSVTLGDFVSIYLALLNGINPTPVDLVEQFKVEMNK